jgi:hypothetical protein
MLGLQIVVIIGVVIVVVLSAWYTMMHNQSHEPPSVSSNIPLVGHLMGLIQHGPKYFSILWRVIYLIIWTI